MIINKHKLHRAIKLLCTYVVAFTLFVSCEEEDVFPLAEVDEGEDSLTIAMAALFSNCIDSLIFNISDDIAVD